jgi:hypothetical protein
MTKEQFEQELRRAEAALAESGSLYWCGFRRGLRRAFLGNAASSQIDHFAWLDFYRDADRCVAELGAGYIDGLETVVRNDTEDARHERLAGSRREPRGVPGLAVVPSGNA